MLDRENDVFMSAASVWEAEIKRALGKLNTRDNLEVGILQAQCLPLSITPAHGVAAGRLPRHHNDPFDRMLIAQARTEDLILVTTDRALRRYDVSLLDPRQPPDV